MNNKISLAFGCVCSAVISGIVGYSFAKKKYTRKCDEEKEKLSASLRRYYSENYVIRDAQDDRTTEHAIKNSSDSGKKTDVAKDCINTSSIHEEKKKMKDYVNYAKKYQPNANEDESVEPYILSGEEEAFSITKEIIPYTLYSDRQIADDNYAVISNPAVFFGEKNFDRIYGDGEDAIYVYNPKLGKVFEIVKEDRTYREAAGKYAGVFGTVEEVEESEENADDEFEDEIDEEYGDYADRF